MRIAEKKDRDLVSQIIVEAFDDNPSANWVIKNDHKRKQRLKALAEYAFDYAFRRNGVYISSENNGIAICYDQRSKGHFFADLYDQIILIFRAISFARIPTILKRQSYAKSVKPKNGKYLYFWFFAVSNHGRGSKAAWELKDAIFKKSDETGLLIYLETSVPQNLRVYERFGFEIHHEWHLEELNLTLWFMRKYPNT